MIQENEEFEKIQNELKELKQLREELSAKAEEKVKKNNYLKEKTKKVEEQYKKSNKNEVLTNDLNFLLDSLENEILEIEKDIKKTAKEYEESSKRLKVIIDEFNKKIENSKLLSEEDIKVLIEENEKLKLAENEKSEEIKKKLDIEKKIVSQLKAKKTKMKNNIEKANALGLTLDEYQEITSAIMKTTIMNAILDKKGLNEIIAKKASDRTKEEKAILREAKKEILDEISKVKKANKDYSVLDAIGALYSLDVTYQLNKKPRVTTMTKNELIALQNNSLSLSYRIINNATATKTYVPQETPKDMQEVIANENTNKEEINLTPANEKITIFKDNDEYYVRKYTVNRLKLKTADLENEVRINGSVCYKIKEKDIEKIKNNANNSFSPYIVSIKEIDKDNIIRAAMNNIEKQEEVPIESEYTELRPVEEIPEEEIEEYTIVEEEQNDEELEEYITNNEEQNEEEIKEIPSEEIETENENKEEKIELAPEIPAPTDKVENNTVDNVEIKPNTPRIITVEGIINKITTDIKIGAKDGKRYVRSNIKCTQYFKNELSSGNYVYNIVHTVPTIIGLGATLLTKISSNILLGPTGKKRMAEVRKRLDELDDQELDELLNNYIGSYAKQVFAPQINDLIIEKMRVHVLNKVSKINEEIKLNYAQLFSTLEEMDEIEDKYNKRKTSKEMKEAYVQNHDNAMKRAAGYIRNITDKQAEGNRLLSGGLHGFEEDLKAVDTKLIYVGNRWAKEHKFNNKLREKLANVADMLKEGLVENDEEKIVNSFMERERLYYENTKVSHSIFGKRSTGETYYTPYVERLDYRQDPFVRDLITTVAATTAVVSAINTIRIHQMEEQIIQAEQAEANRINAANDALVNNVSTEATRIVGGRQAIQKGLEAQMHQDVLNTSNGLERYALDHLNWTTGTEQYRALDDANHAMYNSFYDTVNSQINYITNSCGAGTMTHAEALQEMSNLAASSQSTFVNVAQTCLNELKVYAPAHSQFDLHGPMEALQYIVDNPNAIIDMNTTAINATNIADGLIGLSPEYVTALSSLPSDWTTTLLNVAGSAALVNNVIRGMSAKEKGNSKAKWKESEDIRKMMDEYIETQKEKDKTKEK